MLDSIAVNRHHERTRPFTIGLLAECLLFYGQVNVVASHLELELLLRKCGIDLLLELLRSQVLKLHVNFHFFGASRTPGTKRLNYGLYSNAADIDLRTFAYRCLYKVYRNAGKCNTYADLLAPLLIQYKSDSEQVQGFMLQEDFTTIAFREVVQRNYPGYPVPVDLYYRLESVPPGQVAPELAAKYTFEARTNFDVAQFERHLAKDKKAVEPSAGVDFMMQAAAAIQDVEIARVFRSELSADEENQPIIQKAILNLDQYIPSNESAVLDFNEHILDGCPSIAETIDSGRRTFDEFMVLLNRSQRFRAWLRETPDDGDHTIISEYLRECEASTFTESLPFKLLKFVVITTPIVTSPLEILHQPALLTNALNLVVPTLAEEAATHLSHPFNRWKPNQYVQQSLVPFLGK